VFAAFVQVRRTGGALPLVADFVGRSPLDRRAGAAPSTQFALFSIILPPGEWSAEVVYEGGYAATAYHGGTLRREAVALRKRLRAKAGGPPVLGLCDKFSVLPADLGNVEISTTSWPQLLDDRTNKDEFKTWRDENGTIGAVRLGLGDAGELRASAAIFCRESGANVSDLFDLRVQAELVQRQRRAPAAAAAAADDDNDNASAGEMDVDADTGAAAAATTAATSATAAAADADSRAAVVETVTPLTIVSAGARFRGEGRQFALRRSNVAVHGPCVVRVVLTATAKADEQVPVTRVIEVPVASFCFGDDKQCVLGDAVPVPPTDKSKLKAYEKLRKKVVRSDTNGPKLRAPGKMFGRDDGQAGAASGNCGTLAYHAPTDALRDDVLDKLVHIAIQLDAFESERRIGTLAKAAKTTTTPAAVAVATTTPTQQEKGKGRKGGDGAAVAVPVAVAARAGLEPTRLSVRFGSVPGRFFGVGSGSVRFGSTPKGIRITTQTSVLWRFVWRRLFSKRFGAMLRRDCRARGRASPPRCGRRDQNVERQLARQYEVERGILSGRLASCLRPRAAWAAQKAPSSRHRQISRKWALDSRRALKASRNAWPQYSRMHRSTEQPEAFGSFMFSKNSSANLSFPLDFQQFQAPKLSYKGTELGKGTDRPSVPGSSVPAATPPVLGSVPFQSVPDQP
jgi:hypothetical protein